MVATNAAGPRSVRSGSVRSWVEAIEIIGADGAARRVVRGAGSPKGVPAGPGERFHLSAGQRRLIATRFPKTRKNAAGRSEEHTSELQSPYDLVCRLLLEKKNRYKSLSLRIFSVSMLSACVMCS